MESGIFAGAQTQKENRSDSKTSEHQCDNEHHARTDDEDRKRWETRDCHCKTIECKQRREGRRRHRCPFPSYDSRKRIARISQWQSAHERYRHIPRRIGSWSMESDNLAPTFPRTVEKYENITSLLPRRRKMDYEVHNLRRVSGRPTNRCRKMSSQRRRTHAVCRILRPEAGQ